MDPPSPPPPQPDPLLIAQEQAAQAANVAALQQQAQGDTASLMARYGTRLAIAGAASGTATTGSPLMMPPGTAALMRAGMLSGKPSMLMPGR